MNSETPNSTSVTTALVPTTVSDPNALDVVEYSETRPTNVLSLVHGILRGRYLLAILLAILGAVTGAWLGYNAKAPIYQSIGVIRFKPILPRVLFTTEQNSLVPMFDAYLDAQANLIASQRIIELAMQDPRWIEVRNTSSNQQEVDFKSSLAVGHPRNSELVMISFSDLNAVAAQRGAAAIIRAYAAISDGDDDTANLMPHLQTRQNDLTNQLKAINERTLSIAKDFGSNTLDTVYQNKLTQLDEVETELHQAEIAVAQALPAPANSATTDLSSPSGVTAALEHSPEYSALKNEKRNLEIELDTARLTYLDGHPVVKQLQAQLADINKWMAQLTDNYVGVSATGGMTVATDGPLTRDQLQSQETEIAGLYKRLKEETVLLGQKCVELQDLQRQATETKAKLDETNQRIDELSVESGVSGRFTPEDPDLPLAPIQDKRASMSAFGGVAGSILGVGLIFGIGLIDQRVRYLNDVTNRLAPGLRLLGVLPHLPENGNDPINAGLAAQSVHQIRTLLQRRRGQGEKTVLTITSALPGAGKTSLAIALGLSFAATGYQTLLIDCDIVGGGLTSRLKKMIHRRIGRILRKEGRVTTAQFRAALDESQRTGQRVGEVLVKMGLITQEHLDRELEMQQKISAGLHEAIHGDPLAECVAFSGTPRLWLMPLGSAQSRHASQLNYTSLVRILNEARNRFDVIILDTGPVLGSLEGLVTAMVADEVVLTVARGEHRPAVNHALHYLASNGVNIAGAVLNRAHTGDISRLAYSSSSNRIASSGRVWKSDVPSVAPDTQAAADRDGLVLGPVGTAVASMTDCGYELMTVSDVQS
jgi:Mrp family chromosome partitioning ATPase/uncharacterized protein involved in exopolysaccharide biosynthesis